MSVIPLVAEESTYAEEELPSLKLLTSHEIESLRFGGGMGFAKVAELNRKLPSGAEWAKRAATDPLQTCSSEHN